MRRPLCLAALVATATALLAADPIEAFRPTREPVSPAGVRAACDLPPSEHMRNTGGMGRGGPGTGAGLCVFTSCEVADRWNGNGSLKGFQRWMTNKPGGGSPKKLAAMVEQFCREKGVAVPDYVQHTGGDMAFLDLAIRTRRMVAITYAGMDDFYGGPVDHMVDLPHLDRTSAGVIDNNRPGLFVWMTRGELEQRWKARGGGWAVVFLTPPPAPKPQLQRLPAPPATPAKSDECPDGLCPLRKPHADRSASSVYVRRDMGSGNAEAGTGTVVACRDGKSLVLTNAHVVPDATRPVSVFADRREYKARHVASTRVAPGDPDLCLLSVDAELPAVTVAEVAPPAGTSVYQWGYGGRVPGLPPVKKFGVTEPQGNFVGPKTMRTSIPSQSGDSGAGVFDDRGRLVGVCWGGTGREQFCVSLASVKAFLAGHATFQAATVGAAPMPKEIPNHGIDRDDLDALTSDGRHRYWVRGRESGPHEAHALVGGAGTLVDDSDRYYLSAVGDDAARRKLDAAFADPRLAKYVGRVHVRVYPPDSWVARDRLSKPVTLQAPTGSVIGTLDEIDLEMLLLLLRAAFEPVPAPMPPPPAVAPNPTPVPGPVVVPQPQPAPGPQKPDRSSVIAVALAVIAILVGVFRRRSSVAP